jgi:hypothetical protein
MLHAQEQNFFFVSAKKSGCEDIHIFFIMWQQSAHALNIGSTRATEIWTCSGLLFCLFDPKG